MARNPNGERVQVQLPEDIGCIFAPLVDASVPFAGLPVVAAPSPAEGEGP